MDMDIYCYGHSVQTCVHCVFSMHGTCNDGTCNNGMCKQRMWHVPHGGSDARCARIMLGGHVGL